MGMEAILVQATPAQLDQFRENPNLAYQYVTGDPGEGDDLARIEAITRATFNRMGISAEMREAVERQFQAMARPGSRGPQLVKRQQPEPDKKEFSLSKDWHVLHYALNGTAEGGEGPLGFAVFGDEAFPGDDMDFGPARYLTPTQVKDVSVALQKIEPSSLLSKLDYEDAIQKKIYLCRTLVDLEDWSYLPEFFEEFRNFYSDAAEVGNGMIMKIV